jgi:gas vesicle protein
MALRMAGASVAAIAVGWALGVLFAPASGSATRRRLAWRAQRGYRSMRRTGERLFDRAADLAGEELQATAERVFERVGKGCSQ